MEKNKKNEELQSRRQFFKKAAKGALPILGALFLANAPMFSMKANTSCMCSGNCNGACSGGCLMTCRGGCKTGCEENCSHSCNYNCNTTCKGSSTTYWK